MADLFDEFGVDATGGDLFDEFGADVAETEPTPAPAMPRLGLRPMASQWFPEEGVTPAEAGLAGATSGTLGLSEAIFRTPGAAERWARGLSESIEGTTGLPRALNPLRAVESTAGYLAYGQIPGTNIRTGGGADIAERIDESQKILAENFAPFRENALAAKRADDALKQAIAGDYSGIADVVTDPKAMAGFIGQAAPSLAASYLSGGSIPFMAWMESMEVAKNADEFEERTGQRIPDRQFMQAQAQAGIINSMLEKVVPDALLKGEAGKSALNIALTGGKEFTTEGLQAFNTNLAEMLSFNAEKDLAEGVLPGALGGLGAGTGAGAAQYAVGRSTNEQAPNKAGDEMTADDLATEIDAPVTVAEVEAAAREPEVVPEAVRPAESAEAPTLAATDTDTITGAAPEAVTAVMPSETTTEAVAPESAPLFPITETDKGGITVLGDPDAIRQTLKSAGVPDVGIKSARGVMFGKSRAEAVRAALAPMGAAQPVTAQAQAIQDAAPAQASPTVKESLTVQFRPTHELPDGTPVIATDEPNVWADAKGNEYENNYAQPIQAASDRAPGRRSGAGDAQEPAPRQPVAETARPVPPVGEADAGRANVTQAAPTGEPDAQRQPVDAADLGPIYRDWIAKKDHRISAYPSDETLAKYEKFAKGILAGNDPFTSAEDFERFARLRRYASKHGFDLKSTYTAFDNGQDVTPDERLKTAVEREQGKATAFPITTNPKGSITVQGDPEAIRSALQSAGVPHKGLKAKNGVTFSKNHAEAVRKALDVTDTNVGDIGQDVEAAKETKSAGIDSIANEAATHPDNDLPEPTDAQKEAGNYRKGHVTLHGLDISIENPRGSERSGIDPGGQRWSVTMAHHYGYITGTVGRDKDHLDVFLGPDAENADLPVFVIDQVSPDTGRFDEHKILMGFADEQAARSGYLANYSKGWEGLGGITQMSMDEFKTWLRDGDTTKRITARNESAADRVARAAPMPIKKGAAAPANAARQRRQLTEDVIYRGSRPAVGMKAADVRAAIAPVILTWGDNAPAVEVVDNQSGLPEHIRRQIGEGGTVQGVHDSSSGTVYLVADALSNKKDALRILAHEAVGHYGLEEVMGDTYQKAVDRVKWLKRAGNKKILAIADRVASAYPGIDANTEAREILAHLAEERQFGGVLKDMATRIYAAVRQFLRRLGFKVLWSTPEIDAMLARAARYLREDGGRRRAIPEALEHPQLGEIDVALGKGRMGASKFVAEHPEIGANLEDLIAGSKVVSRDAETATLENGGVIFGLIKKAGRWVLTDARADFARSDDTQGAYESRIDELFAGEKPSPHGVRVLDRSDVLNLLGYGDLPIHVAEGKVSAGQYNHGLTAEHWKKIPEWLENPVAVFDSDTVAGRLVFVAPDAVRGAPVVMIVEPETTMGRVNVHLLVNAYEKTGRLPVQRWVEDGLLRYLDEKQSPVVSTTTGLRLPRVVHQQRGSKRRILTQRDLVKRRAEPTASGMDFARAAAQPAARQTASTQAALDEIPAETAFQRQQRLHQDKFNRFRVIEEWLQDRGASLTEASSVYRAEERYHGRVATRTEDFREQTLKPLIKKIQKAGFTLDQVAEFLHAQHAEERNEQIAKINPAMPDGGSGMTNAEADAILTKAPKELADLANEYRAITDRTREMLLKAGIITQEMADAWQATYEHYVPLKGGDEAVAGGTGKGFTAKNKQKRAMGHRARDEMILENIQRDHERAIMLVEKNRVGQHLLRLAVDAGVPDLITIDKPKKRAVLRDIKTYDVTYHGSTVGSFNSLEAARAFVSMEAGKAGRDASDFSINVSHDPTVAYMASPMLQPNETQVYVDGHAVRVQFNDELLAQAYNNLGTEHMNAIFRAGRQLNAYLSRMYTGYSIDFIFTNAMRDWTSGLLNITGAEGIRFAAKAAKNYPKAAALLAKYAATGKPSQLVKQYRADGGTTGAAYLSDLERLGHEAKAAYDQYAGLVENVRAGKPVRGLALAGEKAVTSILKPIERLNMVFENAMRLSAYMTALESGMSREHAASLAKNATVNFNRKGEIGQQMNALWLFHNASVQGTAIILKSLFRSKHKRQVQALVGGLVSIGALMAATMGGADDDEYEKLPEHVKERNLTFRTEGGWATIPIPYGYGWFVTLGRKMHEAATGKISPAEAALRVAANLAEETTVFGTALSADEPEAKDFLFLLPTAVQIPAVPAMNRTAFHSPLYPESFNPEKPDSQLMYRNTIGSIWDKTANWMNEATGGDAARRGWVDVSPETLKYIWNTATGGTGRGVTDTINAVSLAIQGADPELRELPIVRRFAQEDQVSGARARFWKHAKEAKAAKKRYDLARKAKSAALVDDVVKQERHLLQLADMANDFSKAISAKRDEIDRIRNDETISLAKRRLQIKALEKEEEKLYDQYVERHKRVAEEAKADQRS